MEVRAGKGLMPVRITVPAPVIAEVDTDADEVYGQIGGWSAICARRDHSVSGQVPGALHLPSDSNPMLRAYRRQNEAWT
jgi:hypothetical protein